jgi:hypothetical protein
MLREKSANLDDFFLAKLLKHAKLNSSGSAGMHADIPDIMTPHAP